MSTFAVRHPRKLQQVKAGGWIAALVTAAATLMGVAEFKFDLFSGEDHLERRISAIERGRSIDSVVIDGIKKDAQSIKEDTKYLRGRLDTFLDNRDKD